MTNINLVDVTIHIDENTNSDARQDVEAALRAVTGVVSVHMPNDKAHLLVVEYDRDATSSSQLLTMVEDVVGHAELIGL